MNHDIYSIIFLKVIEAAANIIASKIAIAAISGISLIGYKELLTKKSGMIRA